MVFNAKFFPRDFARLTMYVMHMQRFDFWTENNYIYEYIVQSVVLRHVGNACDEYGTHVDDLDFWLSRLSAY